MPVTTQYLLKRVLSSILVVIGVLVLVFTMTRILPVKPEVVWAGPRARPEDLERVRAMLHLDQPPAVQLALYLRDFFASNWGVSWATKRPVLQDVLQALPATLELVTMSFLLAFLLGSSLGFLAALRRNSVFDEAIRVFALLAASVPTYWIALVLIYVFSVSLGVLPSGGRVDTVLAMQTGFHYITGFVLLDSLVQGDLPVFLDALRRMLLPMIAVALYPLGLTIRLTRALSIEILNEPYTRALYSWGVSERTIVNKYVMRSILATLVSALGLSFGYTIVGSFLVEVIFTWPGLGYYVGSALLNYDSPAIVGGITLAGIIYVAINTAVDILHAYLDPRVSL